MNNAAPLSAGYLEMMRAHIESGGKLSHQNAVDLLAEVQRLQVSPSRCACLDGLHVTTRLRRLRQRSGLSMKALAKALGLRGASSYQRYEDETLNKTNHLRPDIVEKLARALIGRGAPPIGREEVLALSFGGPKGQVIVTGSFETPARIVDRVIRDCAQPGVVECRFYDCQVLGRCEKARPG